MKKIGLSFLFLLMLLLFSQPVQAGITKSFTLAVDDQIVLDPGSAKSYSWKVSSGKSYAKITSATDTRTCKVKCLKPGTASIVCNYTYGRAPLTITYKIEVVKKASKTASSTLKVGKITSFSHYAKASSTSQMVYEWKIVSGKGKVAMWSGTKQTELTTCKTKSCAFVAKKAGTVKLQCTARAKFGTSVSSTAPKYVYTVTLKVTGASVTPTPTPKPKSSTSASSDTNKVKLTTCRYDESISTIKKSAVTLKSGDNLITMGGKYGFAKYTATETGTFNVMYYVLGYEKKTGYSMIYDIAGSSKNLLTFDLQGGYTNQNTVYLCTEMYFLDNTSYYSNSYRPQQTAKLKMQKGHTYYFYIYFPVGNAVGIKISR